MPPSDPPQDPVALARKLVGLAEAQRDALARGSQEQFRWLIRRRDVTTDHLSRLLAAGVQVSPDESQALLELRAELLAADDVIIAQLGDQVARAAVKGRRFKRARKALSSYLSVGPRSGTLDTLR